MRHIRSQWIHRKEREQKTRAAHFRSYPENSYKAKPKQERSRTDVSAWSDTTHDTHVSGNFKSCYDNPKYESSYYRSNSRNFHQDQSWASVKQEQYRENDPCFSDENYVQSDFLNYNTTAGKLEYPVYDWGYEKNIPFPDNRNVKLFCNNEKTWYEKTGEHAFNSYANRCENVCQQQYEVTSNEGPFNTVQSYNYSHTVSGFQDVDYRQTNCWNTGSEMNYQTCDNYLTGTVSQRDWINYDTVLLPPRYSPPYQSYSVQQVLNQIVPSPHETPSVVQNLPLHQLNTSKLHQKYFPPLVSPIPFQGEDHTPLNSYLTEWIQDPSTDTVTKEIKYSSELEIGHSIRAPNKHESSICQEANKSKDPEEKNNNRDLKVEQIDVSSIPLPPPLNNKVNVSSPSTNPTQVTRYSAFSDHSSSTGPNYDSFRGCSSESNSIDKQCTKGEPVSSLHERKAYGEGCENTWHKFNIPSWCKRPSITPERKSKRSYRSDGSRNSRHTKYSHRYFNSYKSSTESQSTSNCGNSLFSANKRLNHNRLSFSRSFNQTKFKSYTLPQIRREEEPIFRPWDSRLGKEGEKLGLESDQEKKNKEEVTETKQMELNSMNDSNFIKINNCNIETLDATSNTCDESKADGTKQEIVGLQHQEKIRLNKEALYRTKNDFDTPKNFILKQIAKPKIMSKNLTKEGSERLEREQLYKVNHKTLNIRDLKKSSELSSVAKPVINTCSSALSIVAMPAVCASSNNISSIARPDVKVHSSIKNTILKTWQEALVKKDEISEENEVKKSSQEKDYEKHKEAITVKKVRGNSKHKKTNLDKQKAKLKFVKRKIELMKIRCDASNRQSEESQALDNQPCSVHEYKGDGSHGSVHPKLRHKVSKHSVTTTDLQRGKSILAVTGSKKSISNFVEVDKNKPCLPDQKELPITKQNLDAKSKMESVVGKKRSRDILSNRKDKQSECKGINEDKQSVSGMNATSKSNTTENTLVSSSLAEKSGLVPKKGSKTLCRGRFILSTPNVVRVRPIQRRKTDEISTESTIDQYCKLARDELKRRSVSGKKSINDQESKSDVNLVQGMSKQANHSPVHTKEPEKPEETENKKDAVSHSLTTEVDRVPYILDTPLTTYETKSGSDICYAVQSLLGPIISSTYYKQYRKDDTELRVIRHAKEELLGYAHEHADLSKNDASNSNISESFTGERTVDETLSQEEKRSETDSPKLIIDVVSSCEKEPIPDTDNRKDKNNLEECVDNNMTQKSIEKVSNIQTIINRKSIDPEYGITCSLGTMNTTIDHQQYKTSDAMKGTNTPSSCQSMPVQASMSNDLTYELHLRYVQAKQEVEAIDGTRSFIHPLPALAPQPPTCYLAMNEEGKMYSKCNDLVDLNRYSPTKEDFEHYKEVQKQRFRQFNSPLFDNTGDGTSIACQLKDRSAPVLDLTTEMEPYTYRQNRENGICKKCPEYLAVPLLYNCDSTTQTYDEMIDDVTSTDMFNTNNGYEIEKVIEEVVTEDYLGAENSPDIVKDISLLSDERFDESAIENMDNSCDFYSKTFNYPDISNYGRYQTISHSNSPIRLTRQRRHRYNKRFPVTMPRIKKEKYNTERDLYQSACKFLGDFDKNTKRSCRLTKRKIKCEEAAVEKKQTNVLKKQDKKQLDNKIGEKGEERMNWLPGNVKIERNLSDKMDLDNLKLDKKDTVEAKDKIYMDRNPSKVIAKLKISDLVTNCPPVVHSGIRLPKHQITENGKLIRMRKHFDKEALKKDGRIICNKTPVIKMENLDSGKKLGGAIYSSSLKKFQSGRVDKLPVASKLNNTDKLGLAIKVRSTDTLEVVSKANCNKKLGLAIQTSSQEKPGGDNKSSSTNKLSSDIELRSHKKHGSAIESENLSKGKPKIKKFVRCKVCHGMLDVNFNRHVLHYQRNHKSWCMKCQKNFPDVESCKKHVRRNHDIPVFCGICGLTFVYKSSFQKHCESAIHKENLKKQSVCDSTMLALTPKTTANGNTAIMISSEKSSDNASIHYVSSSSAEDVCSSPDRNQKTLVVKKKDSPKDSLVVKKTEVRLKFCEACKKFYKLLSAHMKTEKHVQNEIVRKQEIRKKRLALAKLKQNKIGGNGSPKTATRQPKPKSGILKSCKKKVSDGVKTGQKKE